MLNTNPPQKSLSLPKRVLSIVIILATLGYAVYYLDKHRYLITDLKNIPKYVLIEVLLLNFVMLFVLVLIFKATMKLVNVRVHAKESTLINAYSLFMNFFIPGQTGTALRAYYMKKDHALKYLDFAIATAIYYLVYGLMSVGLVIAGSQPYYLSLPLILLAVLLGILFTRVYLSKRNHDRLNLSSSHVLLLCLATLAQVIVQGAIYFVEIHNVQHGVKLNHVITYTGIANLALFVSLTPGAIGIREAFLLFTRRLNHIPASTIVLANIIDRSVFIIFLLILGLLITGLKIKSQLDSFANKKVE